MLLIDEKNPEFNEKWIKDLSLALKTLSMRCQNSHNIEKIQNGGERYQNLTVVSLLLVVGVVI